MDDEGPRPSPQRDNKGTRITPYEVDCRGNRKRYLRLSWTSGTETGSNQLIGAVGTLSRNPAGASAAAGINSSSDDSVVVV